MNSVKILKIADVEQFKETQLQTAVLSSVQKKGFDRGGLKKKQRQSLWEDQRLMSAVQDS